MYTKDLVYRRQIARRRYIGAVFTRRKATMANAITTGRVLLLFVAIWVMYGTNPQVVQWCGPAIVLIILADALDGWVARRRSETSQFGSIFDIVGDRIVEMVCWIVFAHLGLIPVWVPLLVVVRGVLVDGLRSSSYSDGMTPFGESNMMRSKLTTWLTAGRFMRGFFGFAKAVAFVFLAIMHTHSLPGGASSLLGQLGDFGWFRVAGWVLVWTAVALTVIRAVPVIIDSVSYLRDKDK